MTDTKFTPGPWAVCRNWEFGPVSDLDDQTFGMVLPIGDVFGDNREANAHLIGIRVNGRLYVGRPIPTKTIRSK